MRKTKYLGILVLAFILVGGIGCATASSDKMSSMKTEMTADDATAAIAAADAARKKAGSVSGEWRDTGKIIGEAEEAAKAGDFAKAVKLANKAKVQGERGYEQMVSQEKLRLPSYFK
ncbi:MAG: SoxXA-binding protein [Sedimenticola sp.]|nr:MAG: SoxXA-binding protein [Sedimenticola sp.]